MNNKNKFIINAIACFVEAYQSMEGKAKELDSIRYLLGQTIRQYDVPTSNCHISKAALKLWNELTSDDINKFLYREPVKCDILTDEKILPKYIGSHAEPDEKEKITLHHNDTFYFRDVFHVDHVIPVSMIFDELINLDVITEESIQNILDKIHLCRILKSEDRRLGRTRGRTLDFAETIQNVYYKRNVEII